MIDMKSRTACFTGHRELPADDLPEISKRLKDTHSSSTIPRLFNDYDGTERHNPRKKHETPPRNCLQRGFVYEPEQPKSLIPSGFQV